MAEADLNLLIALDALLAEGSVAGAARRLALSPSAVSRALARLRAATADPLLVRAGRVMVPTPYAEELRGRVRDLAQDARAVLRPPARTVRVAELDRSFTIRANEGFLEALGPRLVAAVTEVAPGVRLRFAPKPDKDPRPLREGLVDLELGVSGEAGPELRVQALFRDHFVGIAREGHPLLAGEITPERYAAFGHVVASRRGQASGPVDAALAALGLVRKVVVVVPGFPAALAIARASDLVALATRSLMGALAEREPASGSTGLRSFPLPVPTEPITISQLWHPRQDADPAHRWLRGLVLACCRERPSA
jgi:DNA-binding transcriptional LysR family regulator